MHFALLYMFFDIQGYNIEISIECSNLLFYIFILNVLDTRISLSYQISYIRFAEKVMSEAIMSSNLKVTVTLKTRVKHRFNVD